MTSVDSGVETGNDSNDSSTIQHESHYFEIENELVIVRNDCSKECDCMWEELGQSDDRQTLRPPSVKPSRYLTFAEREFRRERQNSSEDLRDLSKKNHLAQMCHDSTCARLFSNYSEKYCSRNSGAPAYLKAKRSRITRDIDRDVVSRWHIKRLEEKLRWAAISNNTMMVKALLDSGVSPNSCDRHKRTPLHHAACRGYAEVVNLLLEYGADPNQRDCIGNTPLHLATVTSKVSVVTQLLTAGTDVLALDKYGYNPVQLAKTKLKLLGQSNEDLCKIKEEMQHIVKMLLVYLKKRKNTQDQMETLTNFCSRLSLSNTSGQVQDDVKDLLENLNTLTLAD